VIDRLFVWFLFCGITYVVLKFIRHIHIVTRAIDRLEALNLVLRADDPIDRRSVLVKRTPTGSAYLRDVRKIMSQAAQ
jgi:DNA-binding MarR family transcriptional regulator